MDKEKNIMNIPTQPFNQKIFKYSLTTIIIFASLWSAAGLEITLERILDAPRQIGILVGAMFPLDLSQEAFDRIIPKVFESLFIACMEIKAPSAPQTSFVNLICNWISLNSHGPEATVNQNTSFGNEAFPNEAF